MLRLFELFLITCCKLDRAVRMCIIACLDNACQVEEDEDDRDRGDIAQAENQVRLNGSFESSAVGQLVAYDLAIKNPTDIYSCEQSTSSMKMLLAA